MERRKNRLIVENLGPIKKADVTFGDLTVLVGPQASGKSIFLQAFKLVLDQNHVHDTFAQNSIDYHNNVPAFLDAYFGRGMGVMRPGTRVSWEGKEKKIDNLARRKSVKGSKKGRAHENLFYIPAQRVVSLSAGSSRAFGSFDYGDPYVLRSFADRLHFLLQNEFGSTPELFPARGRLSKGLRGLIKKQIFEDATLKQEVLFHKKTLSLKIPGQQEGLAYLSWSAGQREFTPLLLGIYWLCPAGATSTRQKVKWVVIEEPEMGLHPRAIETFLILVLELIRRGYQVVVSTHSTDVLDLVWAVRTIKERGGSAKDIRELFSRPGGMVPGWAKSALDKNKSYKVYFFENGKEVLEISTLDPTDQNEKIASWGELTGFASRSEDIVSKVVSRHEQARHSGRSHT